MTITVQRRVCDGNWHTRTAFINENKMVRVHTISKRDLLDLANRNLSLWHANYHDDAELRVFDSEDRRPTEMED